MSKWIKISDVNDLKSGDIFACPSKVPKSSPIFPDLVVPFVSHVGIIIFINGKPNIIHNPFDNRPEIVPYETVFDGKRNIERIIRTNLTTEEILNRYKECDDFRCEIKSEFSLPYRFFHRNCEDFVRRITGFDIGFDQRLGFGILLGIIIIILLLIFKRRS